MEDFLIVCMFDVSPFCFLCLKYPILLPGIADLEERFFEGFISWVSHQCGLLELVVTDYF